MMPFPLSAMVGQETMRLALILNAIDPTIGGVLICGRRGTGKSTAVRALSSLLPEIVGVADCPYFCDPAEPQWQCSQCQARSERGEKLPRITRPVPLVTLPLNASEDRVAGSFDLAAALEQGYRSFSPGLLAAANRGVLYVDEMNLLNDYIADMLLDAAASGRNRVEREGISLIHPARFVLIGTMNPEEGTLRPQLLDRIGLYVEADDVRNPAIRVNVVERRLTYDADPAAFVAEWTESEATLRERISRARQALPSVHISRYFRQVVAHLVARELRAEGHRGDIVVIRTARALAAWEGRQEVIQADVEQAVALAMPHRSRAGTAVVQQLARLLDQHPAGATDTDQPEDLGTIDDEVDERTNEREGAAGLTRPLRGEQDVAQVQSLIDLPHDHLTRKETGRRFLSLTSRRSGRSTRDRQVHPITDIAFAATIRAAAPFQRERGRSNSGKLELRTNDLRQKIRERKTRALLIFVIDGSDSVMARQLMARTKRILLALLQNAYEKRDRVAMLVLRFAQGRLVLPPTRNFTSARRCIEELYVGGCTPLATGLLEGLRLAETERLRDPTVLPVLLVLTDGLANIDLSGNMRSITPRQDALSIAQEIATRHIHTIMIDTNPFASSTTEQTESDEEMNSSAGRELALALSADYYQLCPPKSSTLLKRG
ncbi:MAG: ATP-binding protein [Chloroflexota bacterium]|nr:ATP-binding protein [Chloroflexota bacterium]